ncbi:hypothetical protein [Bdellovibrio sp.]|uniref:hypothetical protein n=1 Tax=Bdellovibrio sp. TaxID=28201 RepID=UPI0039E67BB2
MKNEEKQEFKSSGVLALLGLVGFSAAIIATPWNRQMQDSRAEIALQKAEVVGYQVVQIYREAAKNSHTSGRNPASVEEASTAENLRSTGLMGTDPWGMPFRYRILSSDKAGHVRILVWSSGPNKKAETVALDNEEVAVTAQPVYSGDDVGVLLSVTQN